MSDFVQFGDQRVTPEEKTRKVGEVFSSVARRYDVKGGWKGLYRLNEKKFNYQVKHGKRIFIGQVVRIKK